MDDKGEGPVTGLLDQCLGTDINSLSLYNSYTPRHIRRRWDRLSHTVIWKNLFDYSFRLSPKFNMILSL